MEFHERMAVAHDLHVFWNPVSEEVMDELLWALDPQPGMRVLDIACGVGELLTRMAGYGVSGVGVDISPWALERARASKAKSLPDADLEFVEMDGKDYRLPAAGPFDIVSLVGASWIWDGYQGTLAALHDLVRPDGLVLFGEPYWKVPEPDAAYLEAEELTAASFLDLADLHEAVEAAGFRMTYQVVSSGPDWDRYEMLQSLSVDRWAAAHPEHPDRADVLAIQRRARRTYLRWGRDAVGFTQMILRRVDEGPAA